MSVVPFATKLISIPLIRTMKDYIDSELGCFVFYLTETFILKGCGRRIKPNSGARLGQPDISILYLCTIPPRSKNNCS